MYIPNPSLLPIHGFPLKRTTSTVCIDFQLELISKEINQFCKKQNEMQHHLAVETPTVSLRKFTEQSGRKSHNKENQTSVCDE